MYKQRCAAAIATIVFAMFCFSMNFVSAQEQEVGKDIKRTFLCDTQRQVERFVELGGGPAAMWQVNHENHDPGACGFVQILSQGEKIVPSSPLRDESGVLWEVKSVRVWGVIYRGQVRMTEPKDLYTCFPLGQPA
jgi:hypothetical protein